MVIPFTGKEFQQVQIALLDAFNRSTLEQMARIELDTSLNHVAGGQNETELVHNLIVWAIHEGKLTDLIEGASNQNSGNVLIQKLVKDAQVWDLSNIDTEQFKRFGATVIIQQLDPTDARN
ncbi:MAG: effector-associated domain EAD1-containing protein [Chloroflexota bacterium]